MVKGGLAVRLGRSRNPESSARDAVQTGRERSGQRRACGRWFAEGVCLLACGCA